MARETYLGTLGISAKIVTENPTHDNRGRTLQGARIICVYTPDFRDVNDIGRVLLRLETMGLVRRERSARLYYKCGEYQAIHLSKHSAATNDSVTIVRLCLVGNDCVANNEDCVSPQKTPTHTWASALLTHGVCGHPSLVQATYSLAYNATRRILQRCRYSNVFAIANYNRRVLVSGRSDNTPKLTVSRTFIIRLKII